MYLALLINLATGLYLVNRYRRLEWHVIKLGHLI